MNWIYIRDHVAQVVVVNDFSGPVDDIRVVDRNDLLRSSLGTEHGQNSSSTTHIQDDLVLEEVLVLVDEVTVGIGTDGVLQHGLVDGFSTRYILARKFIEENLNACNNILL